tara:strand:- start:945 stop:1787 length:843 start_codon:yes stop_codon:yes gene_type:complete
MPLHLLARRGVLIMSVNNCPGGLPVGIRPHVWLHTDPTGKFHDSIWHDPAILKFSPIQAWEKTGNVEKKEGIFRRQSDGTLSMMPDITAKEMPGVFGFDRGTSLRPADYLWEAKINRGNDKKSATGIDGKGKRTGVPNGLPHTINTMFAAVRLAFYLGVKTLYLVGADFRMDEDQPYSFNQGKGGAGIRSNNSAYSDMCTMFDALKPHFEGAGFQVLNCTPGSQLWTFDHVDFEEAIVSVTEGFEEELNCEGWYDPKTGDNVSANARNKLDASQTNAGST